MQATTSSLEDEAKKVGLMINVPKTKVMTVGNWSTSAKIKVGSEVLQDFEEFCYLGSTISKDEVVKGKY